MNIQDERELRTQLAVLLDGTEPRSAPVAGTVRRGRTIRVRRRIAAVAGLAAAVAGAVVLPNVLSARPHSAVPLAPAHYQVTVERLDPVAHGGVIARGITDGKSWRVVGSGSAGSTTFEVRGVIGDDTTMGAPGPTGPDGPITTEGFGDNRYNVIIGTVSQQITSVAMQLPNGERPVLRPVSWGGQRLVGIVLPAGVPIVRAVAFADGREVVYAIPFRGTELVAWRPPGQAGPPRVTKSIGAGVVGGKPWHATAWVGPWGWCFSVSASNGSACYPDDRSVKLGSQLVSGVTCEPAMGNEAATGIALAAPNVARVVLQLSDGSSASFPMVEVVGKRIFGYAIPAHLRVTGSSEYGARGQLLGSTRGQAIGSDRPGWTC